ncbi:MAG: hypothetical protein ABSH34_35765 [Verrucomicrobiota bacterium]
MHHPSVQAAVSVLEKPAALPVRPMSEITQLKAAVERGESRAEVEIRSRPHESLPLRI